MVNEFFQKILDETPEDEKIFVDNYEAITMRIFLLLKEKGMTQKDLAEKLDKRPSEISKWLNDGHNLTLKSLSKIEAALGEKIITIPKVDNYEYVESSKSKFRTSFKSESLKKEILTEQYSHTKRFKLRKVS